MNQRIVNTHPSLLLECNEYGLLTENQLLKFYQNELYEIVEEFVDEFLEVGRILFFSRYKCMFHCLIISIYNSIFNRTVNLLIILIIFNKILII